MKIAYTAGPYRAKTYYDIDLHILNAQQVAIELWQMGYAVICPHKNTAHFEGLAPDEVWLKGDLEFISRLQGSKIVLLCFRGGKAVGGR